MHELGADAYAQALSEHRRVLRGAFAAHGGVAVDTQGDAFFVAFPNAANAVAAARAAQEALAVGPIRVRMGLHMGTPKLAKDGYVGADVHLGARIATAGHAGQVLLSKATRELVDRRFRLGRAPDEGVRRAGLALPARLGTVSAPEDDLEHEPAAAGLLLRGQGAGASRRHVATAGRAPAHPHRSRGSGKTRLAIEAAGELVPEFKGRVFWLGLAALTRNHLAEGRRRSDGFLRADEQPTPPRAKALIGPSGMAIEAGDVTAGREWGEQAVTLNHELGDPWSIGWATCRLG